MFSLQYLSYSLGSCSFWETNILYLYSKDTIFGPWTHCVRTMYIVHVVSTNMKEISPCRNHNFTQHMDRYIFNNVPVINVLVTISYVLRDHCSVFGLRHRPCTCATGCLAVIFHFPFLLPIYVFLPVASIWLCEYSLLAPCVRERIEVQYVGRKSRIPPTVLYNSTPIYS